MQENHKPTPEEILSRRLKPDPLTPQKMSAFFSAAEIAMKAVMLTAHAGNVRCIQAEKEMQPYLEILKSNES